MTLQSSLTHWGKGAAAYNQGKKKEKRRSRRRSRAYSQNHIYSMYIGRWDGDGLRAGAILVAASAIWEEWKGGDERWRSSLKLATLVGLAKLPAGGGDVVAGDGSAVAGADHEGEALPVENRVALPVLAPVSWHGLPPCSGTLDRDWPHVAGAAHVRYQHQDEVCVAIDGESYPSFLYARHPVTTAIPFIC